MASLRKREGKYATIKFHIGRGRRKDGSAFDIPTDIPVEPELAPDAPGYAAAKAELEKQALEEVNDVEARVRGKMTEEEYESRAKFRAKKILRQNSTATAAAFLIGWLWQHVIRNRIDYTRTRSLCNLFDDLIQVIPEDCETIHDVRAEPFETLVLRMRKDSYAPSVVNNAVIYLRALGLDIKKITGNSVTDGLQEEASDFDERLPFTVDELGRILKVLTTVTGQLDMEWRILLLIILYTEMRPCDAQKILMRDLQFLDGFGMIRMKSGKTENFRSKFVWKPMHRCLQRNVEALLAISKRGPDEYLLKHLGNMSEKSVSNKFTEILEAAEIDQEKAKGEHRIKEFSKKCLYSVKHTGFTWLDAVGGQDREDDEHFNLTEQSQEHYRHLGIHDSKVLLLRLEKINRMPDIENLKPNPL